MRMAITSIRTRMTTIMIMIMNTTTITLMATITIIIMTTIMGIIITAMPTAPWAKHSITAPGSRESMFPA